MTVDPIESTIFQEIAPREIEVVGTHAIGNLIRPGKENYLELNRWYCFRSTDRRICRCRTGGGGRVASL